MTPGTYIRMRREAAGVTLRDLALITAADPAVSLEHRIEALAEIEADARVLTAAAEERLRLTFSFDPDVLFELMVIHAGAAVTPPHLCRLCACSWHDACHGGCAWSESDVTICTTCEARMAIAAAAPPPVPEDLVA